MPEPGLRCHCGQRERGRGTSPLHPVSPLLRFVTSLSRQPSRLSCFLGIPSAHSLFPWYFQPVSDALIIGAEEAMAGAVMSPRQCHRVGHRPATALTNTLLLPTSLGTPCYIPCCASEGKKISL